MGRELFYKPGSFYRVCDMTGFTVRAGRTKKQWNNIIVRDQSFELRQPQDFVRGVRDDQNVPQARPRPTPTVIGVQTTLATAWVPSFGDFNLDFSSDFVGQISARVLIVASTAGLFVGALISVLLDNQDYFQTKIVSIDFATNSLTISSSLPSIASAGNIVVSDNSIAGVQANNYPSSGGAGT